MVENLKFLNIKKFFMENRVIMKCFYCKNKIIGNIFMAYDESFCCENHRMIFIKDRYYNKQIAVDLELGYDFDKNIEAEPLRVESNNKVSKKKYGKFNFFCLYYLNRLFNKIFN